MIVSRSPMGSVLAKNFDEITKELAKLTSDLYHCDRLIVLKRDIIRLIEHLDDYTLFVLKIEKNKNYSDDTLNEYRNALSTLTLFWTDHCENQSYTDAQYRFMMRTLNNISMTIGLVTAVVITKHDIDYLTKCNPAKESNTQQPQTQPPPPYTSTMFLPK
jgi:hypothetical protein